MAGSLKSSIKNEYIIHLFSLGTSAVDVTATCCVKIGKTKLETVIANPKLKQQYTEQAVKTAK